MLKQDAVFVDMSVEAVEGYKASGYEVYEENGQYEIRDGAKVLVTLNNIKKVEKFFKKYYEATTYTCE